MAAKDLGPLDWKAPIVDSQGRPSPEFQRRWNLQRTNNGLIGTIQFGAGPPTGSPQGGAEYVNTATTPYSVYIGNGGAWHLAGVVAFTDLSDVPSAYTAHGLALLRVKASVDGVEFVTQSAALDSLGAPASGQLLQRGGATWALVTISTVLDAISATRGTVLFRGATAWSALAPGTSGNVLTTAGAGADPSWLAAGGGGGSTETEFGCPDAINPNSAVVLTAGFFFARAIVAERTGTLNSVKFHASAAQAPNTIIPGIYANTAANIIGALLGSGPKITGVVNGLNKFSLTTGVPVTKGQVYWIGFQILNGGGTVASLYATSISSAMIAFFASTVALPNPAPAASYGGTWGAFWASADV